MPLVAWIVTAGPPASGAISVIAATNSREPTAAARADGFGTTWTRARPSGRTQSRANSDGMVRKRRPAAASTHRAAGRARSAEIV